MKGSGENWETLRQPYCKSSMSPSAEELKEGWLRASCCALPSKYISAKPPGPLRNGSALVSLFCSVTERLSCGGIAAV